MMMLGARRYQGTRLALKSFTFRCEHGAFGAVNDKTAFRFKVSDTTVLDGF